MLSREDFEKVEMRVGTIIEANVNKKTRVPAYKLKIDFGKNIGIKSSSAQITTLYKEDDLINKKVVCVMNFEPIRVSEIKSEVRILGTDSLNGVVLLTPDKECSNGDKVY